MFNQKGYEGGSLNEVMAATGLKKGGIYRHFTSKENWRRRLSITPGRPSGRPG